MPNDIMFNPYPTITPSDLGVDTAAARAFAQLWTGDAIPEEAAACLAGLCGSVGPDILTMATRPWGPGVFCALVDTGTEGVTGASGSQAALTVVAQGEATAGLKVEAVLRDAIQRLARDEPDDALAQIPEVATHLLPPWSPGLEHLGDLRWGLLARTAAALSHAAQAGAGVAILLTHEIVSLNRTKEARRRNNREDLDRYVRRLSGGEIPRLERGVLAGPIRVSGVDLYLGKVRRDLA